MSISSHYFDVGIKYTLMYTFSQEVIDKSLSIILLCISPFVVCLLSPSPPPPFSFTCTLPTSSGVLTEQREVISKVPWIKIDSNAYPCVANYTQG